MLVLRPGALGDTLLAVPAVRALRRGFGRLTLAAHPGASRLLEHVGEVDRGTAFDDASLAWVFTNTNVPDEKVVAWMSPAPGLGNALLVAPSRPSDAQHCARYLVSTLAPLGIDLTFDDSPINLEPERTDEVLVHPGSGGAYKNWPPERFAAVIQATDAPLRLIVGEADSAAAARVEACLGRRLARLENPPPEVLASRLAGCRAYLGNDSGVSHLAGLCGAHTFVLFGPTDPRVWRPLGPHVQVINFDADPMEVARQLL